jgi:hypothetical protein
VGIKDPIIANTVAGLIVAFVAALIGLGIAKWYTARQELTRAIQERNLAAAAEMYRIYGDFFAAWKVWNAHLRSKEPPDNARMPRVGLPDEHRRSELLAAAAKTEGGLEALLVRLAMEHDLNHDQRAALWCLRFAFKELREAMQKGLPLLWWRADIHPGDGYRSYQASKKLISLVANLLLAEPGDPPGLAKSREALGEITGPGKEFTSSEEIKSDLGDHEKWLIVAEHLSEDRLRSMEEPPVVRRLMQKLSPGRHR